MRVIDLLNKIANGEEVPKKIKYKHCEYEYKEEIRDYEDYDNEYEGERFYERYLTPRIFKDGNTETMLNTELEIIEEDKKIENIKVKSNFTHNQKQIVRKINEIIDIVNKLKDDRK